MIFENLYWYLAMQKVYVQTENKTQFCMMFSSSLQCDYKIENLKIVKS